MKTKLTFALLLLSVLMRGQEFEEVKFPNYTPPSPESFAITKYPEIQPNEFNGIVSYSLPLYNYKAGKIDIPITLNYSGAGVKVDDVPTWVGINFRLLAGGRITRTVKDLPDENAVYRVFTSLTDLQAYNGTSDGTPASDILQDIVGGSQHDSEVDVFQFDFGNYSGSFYFDQDWEGQLLKKDLNLKIETDGNFNTEHRIKITTPEGLIYHFGGPEAIESTIRRVVVDGSIAQTTNGGVTAFMLTKIEHPVYGTVFLKYHTSPSPEIVINQKIKKYRKFIAVEPEWVNTPCEVPFTRPNECFMGPQYTCLNRIPDYLSKYSTVTISTETTNAKYLDSIYSPNSSEKIFFRSRPVSNPNFHRVLDRIVVKTSMDTIKTIDFDFFGFDHRINQLGQPYDASQRFFLNKITFDKYSPDNHNGLSGQRNEIYEFKYDGALSLPERFDYAQDFLGYFNNKPNGSSIPDTNYFNPFGASGFADRNPVFQYAAKGTLTDIYYPTGGRTHFDYQAKKAKKKVFDSRNLYAYRNMGSVYSNPDQLMAELPTVTPDTIINGINNVIFGQEVNIHFKMVVHNSVSYAERDFIKVKITDLNTQQIDSVFFYMSQPDSQASSPTVINERVLPYVFGEGKSYRIQIFINPDAESPNPHPMEVFMNVEFYTGIEQVEDAGILLMRKTEYSDGEAPENIKRYYYSDVNHLIPTLEQLPWQDAERFSRVEDQFIHMACNINPCCTGGPLTDLTYDFKWLLSEKMDFSSTAELGFFETVTTSYGGDNFENGGTETHFSNVSGIGAILIPTYPVGGSCNHRSHFDGTHVNEINIPSIENGLPILKKTFKNNGGTLQKIKEEEYQYSFPVEDAVINITAFKMYDLVFIGTGSSYENITSNYLISQYLLPSKRSQLISKTVKEYFDPVPIDEIDESSYRKVVSNEGFDYDSFPGLATRVVKSTSDSNIAIENKFYYVDRGAANDLPQSSADLPLTGAQVSAYADLLQNNMVSGPVQSEKLVDGNLVARQRTLFKSTWPTPDTDVFLDVFPEFFLSSKGDNEMVPKVIFLDYDGFGNPTLVKQPSGAKTKYQYNFRGQVTLKIENFTTMVAQEEIPEDYDGNTLPDIGPICAMNANYPGAFVTRYEYDSQGQLLRIIDPKCQKTTFEYDSLHHLRVIRDNEGNVSKTFDMNFKRYQTN